MNFVFDLDGTICFKGMPISKSIMDLLFELQDSEHSICFASARPWRDMLPVLDRRFHDNLLVGANGAMIVKGNQLDHVEGIPVRLAERIISLLEEFHADYLIDDTWNYAHNLSLDNPFLKNVDINGLASRVGVNEVKYFVKIVVLNCLDFSALSKCLQQLDVTIHYHSTEGILDLTYKQVNKMSGLIKTSFDSTDFICFGNDLNDKKLFEKATHSVLIGELPQLKLLAKEYISVDDKIEERIVRKVRELIEK
ncbi:HAD hydrolase family protein [Rossellomorea vietnamensis]|uniref:HAD hydrolase family protein n=1 Tax=Rossellomorea vietnamensis TaxID=218284 RepID=UPI001E355C21|nr:HAD hydrolase family protein [Rossellomorea vietnamensis]MCC5804662.1 HAD hydrolase family protein [Rossellomorea vietnamensis]